MTSSARAAPRVVGLVLAAGSGSRFGRPKALVRSADGETWVAHAVHVVRDGGCEPVYVVLGAAAGEVRREVAAGIHVIEAADWKEGLGASLRAGMSALRQREDAADAVLVMLVDTPGVTARVLRRLVSSEVNRQTLSRATYQGRPGHPVLLGRDHWAGVVESAGGDRGARDYLATRDVELVECADLGDGADVDSAEAWADRQSGESGGRA